MFISFPLFSDACSSQHNAVYTTSIQTEKSDLQLKWLTDIAQQVIYFKWVKTPFTSAFVFFLNEYFICILLVSLLYWGVKFIFMFYLLHSFSYF